MRNEANNFIPATSIAVRDPQLRAAIDFATRNSEGRREQIMTTYGRDHGEALRQQAAEAKRRTLRSLPELLEQAEANMRANGFEVLWAADAAEARQQVLEIVQRHNAHTIVKSKSMLTEEIALNPALEAAGIEVIETDLGEYIVQIAKEPPSHIVGPALHMSKAMIRDLFKRELDMPHTDDAEAMTQFVRERLRRKFLKADVGISGGNMIIAETGTLCLFTNEGNGRMTTSLPPVHIAVVGIEKLIATREDYTTLAHILPHAGTGQTMTVYTQLINGPRRMGETDGPEHVTVILVDNGRSDIYTTRYAEALACLRCGACLNDCPVYRSIGGHAYGWAYSGPIGAVITPLLTGLENATPLPYASTLCGRCKEVCPVDIDLPRMLLDLRHDLVEQGLSPRLWKTGIRAWAATASSPRRWSFAGKAIQKGSRLAPRRLPGPLDGWTKHRDLPPFASQSFHEMWEKRQKEGNHEQS
jgi:L-lactate dehydrogenase complex protein LldF